MRTTDQPEPWGGLGEKLERIQPSAKVPEWEPVTNHHGYERNTVTGDIRLSSPPIFLPIP